jgi:hypothetical protein
MVKKSRRNLYDPSLNPSDDAEGVTAASSFNMEGEGIYKDGSYHDDPLYFQDDAYLEEERQTTEILDPNLHKLQRPNRCRRNVFYLLLSFGALAIIVTMSVLVKKKKATRSSSTANSILAPTVFHPPPADLATTCSLAVINASAENRLKCQEICGSADCCSFPANLDLSCLAGHEDGCQVYHASCGILDSSAPLDTAKYVPPAPKNMDAICAVDKLNSASGLRACADYCLPQKCCYDTVGISCRTNANCMGYAACQNLDALDNIHHQITLEVDAKCSNPAFANACKDACQTSACCFVPNLQCQYKENIQTFCSQYQSCKKVWINNGDDDLYTPTMQPTAQSASPTYASGQPTWTDDAASHAPSMSGTTEYPTGMIDDIMPSNMPTNMNT